MNKIIIALLALSFTGHAVYAEAPAHPDDIESYFVTTDEAEVLTNVNDLLPEYFLIEFVPIKKYFAISITDEGYTSTVEKAFDGDQESLDVWNETIESAKSISTYINDELDDDYTLVITNHLNKQLVILKMVNGEVTYNLMDDIESSENNDVVNVNESFDLTPIQDVANNLGFDDVWLQEETGVIVVDGTVNSIMGEKIALESFNADISYFFDKHEELPDVPVGYLFRGFNDTNGKELSAITMYFDQDTANRDWSEVTRLDGEMYNQSDWFQMTSLFSQYLNNYTSPSIDENNPIHIMLIRNFGVGRDVGRVTQ